MLRAAKQALGREVPQSQAHLQLVTSAVVFCFFFFLTNVNRGTWKGWETLHYCFCNCEITAVKARKCKRNKEIFQKYTFSRDFLLFLKPLNMTIYTCIYLYIYIYIKAGPSFSLKEPQSTFGPCWSGTQAQKCIELPVVSPWWQLCPQQPVDLRTVHHQCCSAEARATTGTALQNFSTSAISQATHLTAWIHLPSCQANNHLKFSSVNWDSQKTTEC